MDVHCTLYMYKGSRVCVNVVVCVKVLVCVKVVVCVNVVVYL